jgi:PhzF family phenazine biosynthesis protein
MRFDEAPLYQVDAFTDEPFKGNPAAVCMMPTDLDDSLYLSIAAEMNLSETAFMEQADAEGEYRLRWFTPRQEVPLCGHATLATAHILFSQGLKSEMISFHTKSGLLYALRTPKGVRLDFPRNDPYPVETIEDVIEALGIEEPVEFSYSNTNQKLLIEVKEEDAVRSLHPDFSALLKCQNPHGWFGVIVTSKSRKYDFVSRYFAPWRGVNEDPVTGSAHTVLAPYWAERLGKRKMMAYQASNRGGELGVELLEKRVLITGKAVTVLEGKLRYPVI